MANDPHIDTVLNADALLAAARRQSGFDDLAEQEIMAPLAQLLTALRSEASLSPRGTTAMAEHLTGCLVARAGIQDRIRRNPEILDQDVSAPLIVTGFPRAGTTKLQRCLAATGAFQYFPLWQIFHPLPLASDPPGTDSRIAITEQIVAQMKAFNPRFCAGHPTDALAADEEAMLLEQTFEDEAHCWYAEVPSYLRWLQQRSTENSYRWLKKIMQVVQFLDEPVHGTRTNTSTSTQAQPRPWLLKSPVHTGRIDELFRIFPNATIVQCHRDLMSVVPSAAALAESMRAVYCDVPDPLAAGRYAMDLLTHATERNIAERAKLPAGQRIVDVEFDAIVGDIEGVVKHIFSRSGNAFTAETAAALRAWEADNPRNKDGEFPYEMPKYGLTRDEITTRFAPYLSSRNA